MRILADENFPGDAVIALRQQGHDVAWIRTDAPGSSDQVVLARAVAEDRLLITFDKDFGALTFQARLHAAPGIVLFRLSLSSPTHVARLVVFALESRSDWAGHFAVVDDHQIRMTPLLSQASM